MVVGEKAVSNPVSQTAFMRDDVSPHRGREFLKNDLTALSTPLVTSRIFTAS